MKKGSLIIVFVMVLKLVSAQTINITGTVKTNDGDALHLAFVQDKQYKNGVYTDSTGSFSLAVNPNSKLAVKCRGFRDTLIDINNQTTFAIVLKPAVNIVASRSNITPMADEHSNINMATFSASTVRDEPSLPNNKGTYTIHGLTLDLNSGSFDMAQGAIFPSFMHKEATQGSRYLFDDWMHGYVITSSDTTIQNPALFFNYDKIGGSLLLTKDKHAAIEVYNEMIKSFTLFDAFNRPYTFTIVPEIDKSHYAQVISSGNNYKIYKSTKTKFTASNYHSDGIASTGNNYDSYDDEVTYYVVDVKTNQLQPLAPKKKALKQVFAGLANKLNKFLADNTGDIDDNYLAALGDYLNM